MVRFCGGKFCGGKFSDRLSPSLVLAKPNKNQQLNNIFVEKKIQKFENVFKVNVLHFKFPFLNLLSIGF